MTIPSRPPPAQEESARKGQGPLASRETAGSVRRRSGASASTLPMPPPPPPPVPPGGRIPSEAFGGGAPKKPRNAPKNRFSGGGSTSPTDPLPPIRKKGVFGPFLLSLSRGLRSLPSPLWGKPPRRRGLARLAPALGPICPNHSASIRIFSQIPDGQNGMRWEGRRSSEHRGAGRVCRGDLGPLGSVLGGRTGLVSVGRHEEKRSRFGSWKRAESEAKKGALPPLRSPF